MCKLVPKLKLSQRLLTLTDGHKSQVFSSNFATDGMSKYAAICSAFIPLYKQRCLGSAPQDSNFLTVANPRLSKKIERETLIK